MGLRPRAAIMQNGTNKGAAVDVMQVLRSSPGLEDIWQLHWSYTAGIEHNAPGRLHREPRGAGHARAAIDGAARRGPRPARSGARRTCPAYWIKVTADANGAFTVTNSRNNFSKTYNPR